MRLSVELVEDLHDITGRLVSLHQPFWSCLPERAFGDDQVPTPMPIVSGGCYMPRVVVDPANGGRRSSCSPRRRRVLPCGQEDDRRAGGQKQERASDKPCPLSRDP